MSRRQRLALAALVVILVLGASIAVGSSIVSSPSPSPSAGRQAPTRVATPSPAGAATPVPKGLVAFDDRKDGFSISYPRTWTRVPADPSDKDVRLVVADGTKVSLLIRDSPVGLTVTTQTLGIARDLTDSLVGADSRAKLLSDPQAITLDGLPGYRYVYTFPAGPGGRRGAHVHYFLFRRGRLISLVFQVPGTRALKRDSGLLDRVAGTFRAVQ